MSLKEVMAKYRWAEEEAMLKGNVDALDEVYAPDLVIHSQSYPFPELKGVEARKQQVITNSKAFEILQLDWEEMIGEGNTIAFRYTMHMKHTGTSPLLPIPPTGKELVLKGCYFMHVKDGKVVECFGYSDMLGILQQAGIVPPPGKQ